MLFVIILFFCGPVIATDLTAEELVRMSQKNMQPYLEEVQKLQQRSTMCKLEVEELFKPVDLKKPRQSQGSPKPPQILVFVSLSMPKLSLQELARQADIGNATLIMRGLKNNSFKDMAAELKELGISVQIDPNLFKQYQITKVPTFVLLSKEPRSLVGNVSLAYAKQKLGEIR